MKDEHTTAGSTEDPAAAFVRRFPPEQRLAGLAPEQVLGAYSPEQRLAGLSEEQLVLALPDAIRCGLAIAYLATIQKAARARREQQDPPPGKRHRHQLNTLRGRRRFEDMKDRDVVVDCFDRATASIIARVPMDQRLAGLTPEQVLGAYSPEQRLAGLTEEQVVLALPDATLSALLEEYFVTLPEETQTALQMRFAGMAPAVRLAWVPPEQRFAGLTEAQVVPVLPIAVLRVLSKEKEYLATLPAEAQAAVQKRLGRAKSSPAAPAQRRTRR